MITHPPRPESAQADFAAAGPPGAISIAVRHAGAGLQLFRVVASRHAGAAPATVSTMSHKMTTLATPCRRGDDTPSRPAGSERTPGVLVARVEPLQHPQHATHVSLAAIRVRCLASERLAS
jgi:hypothetical protein